MINLSVAPANHVTNIALQNFISFVFVRMYMYIRMCICLYILYMYESGAASNGGGTAQGAVDSGVW